jgi:hypothetical protein
MVAAIVPLTFGMIGDPATRPPARVLFIMGVNRENRSGKQRATHQKPSNLAASTASALEE